MEKNVPFKAAGAGARLKFTNAAMEKLFEAYGDGYLGEVERRLDLYDPKCIKLCYELMIIGANDKVSFADVVEKMPVQEIVFAIFDALHLGIHGKKFTDAPSVEDAAQAG